MASRKVSLIVEWDNARLSEQWRAEALLAQLASQTAALDRDFEVIVLYDSSEIDEVILKELIQQSGLEAVPNAQVAARGAPNLHYYELKNEGSRQSSSEILVFVDSDVIPKAGWLASILQPFEHPEVEVVSGNTYIGPFSDLYHRAYALCSYYDLPADPGPAFKSDRQFFVNNLAFRKQVLELYPFPTDSRKFRSQSDDYQTGLTSKGVVIWHAPSAQVMHPPPNGLSHLIRRSLLNGYDSLIDAQRDGHTNLAGRSVRFLAWDLRRCLSRTIIYHRKVCLSLPEVIPAIAIAAVVCLIRWIGFWLSLLVPDRVSGLSKSV